MGQYRYFCSETYRDYGYDYSRPSYENTTYSPETSGNDDVNTCTDANNDGMCDDFDNTCTDANSDGYCDSGAQAELDTAI
jgi:hypothetical protein